MESKDKRFIEDTFPIREVSIEGAKEKNIRRGHISTLHVWWARRPLATSRATNLAALIPVPDTEEEKQKIRNFISELSKWENSNNESLLSRARDMILKTYHGVPPKVFDPFGGGGSIPLEALRLGCETYSNDYNPVAVLIQKCTLQYPQKYGNLISFDKYEIGKPWIKEKTKLSKKIKNVPNETLFLNEPKTDLRKTKIVNPLLEDVKYWGNWVMEESKNEIGIYYPTDSNGASTVGYIWARTIPCQNPTCGTEIPLMRQFWLSNKDGKKIALYPTIKNKRVEFNIVSIDERLVDTNYDPEKGTVSRAVVNCPVCGSITDASSTRNLFHEGKASQKIVAVVTQNKNIIEIQNDLNETVKQLKNNIAPLNLIKALQGEGYNLEKDCFSIISKSPTNFLLVYNNFDLYIEFKVVLRTGKITIESQGKGYRLPTENDRNVYKKAEVFLGKKREQLMDEWGIDPVPDEEIPQKNTHRAVGSQLPLYGFKNWGELFNSRQLLSLIIFVDKIKSAYRNLLSKKVDSDYAKVITTYLAFTLDRMAMSYNTLTQWQSGYEKMGNMFSRQALQMVWDYAEPNAASDAVRSWDSLFEDTINVIDFNSNFKNAVNVPIIYNNSATDLLNIKDNSLDAVFTDPPYYDNVPYSYLSDFFYVWLKRMVGELYPELFSTPLTPKKNEIVVYSFVQPGYTSSKSFFEIMLNKSFKEIYRILKPKGIATIVYAHKSTEGWETLINSLLDSNLIVTGAWPINTERETRSNAQETASLSSSIYIIVRKFEKKGVGFYNEVKEDLKNYLNEKLDRLWGEGIVGADFFIAAIGSAIEVFGKYEKVIDYEGNIKRANVLLDDVREIVMNYTVAHILHNGFSGEVSELTKFYVICRFSYGEAKLEFDEANKLARSVGIDLTQEFNKNGFIKKEKEFVRVLAANNRKIEDLQDKNELIDVLHHSLLLWESDKKDKMIQLLAETGFGKSEALFRVAQAISESLAKTSPESKEKKWIDQFVSTKERIKSNITTIKVKTKIEQQGKIQF